MIIGIIWSNVFQGNFCYSQDWLPASDSHCRYDCTWWFQGIWYRWVLCVEASPFSAVHTFQRSKLSSGQWSQHQVGGFSQRSFEDWAVYLFQSKALQAGENGFSCSMLIYFWSLKSECQWSCCGISNFALCYRLNKSWCTFIKLFMAGVGLRDWLFVVQRFSPKGGMSQFDLLSYILRIHPLLILFL